MAASFTLPTVLANLTAGNQALSLIDSDLTTLRDPLLALGTFSNYYTDTGAANAYAITVSAPQTVTQAAGLLIQFIATNKNTGASTFQINALTVKNILYPNGAALAAGAIPANAVVTIIYDGTQYQLLSAVAAKQPTRQVFTSGTAQTYTTPAGATRINVRMVGGGGGGGGATANNGTIGNDTTFSTLTASGGTAGQGNGGQGAAGGAASGGDINIPGGGGGAGSISATAGVTGPSGNGGNSAFGGAGIGKINQAGGNGATNSGGGGGGGGGASGTNSGGGGGAGGYVEKLILAPAATYTYTVGAIANGASAGGNAGGNGAAGIIIVDEMYD